jgi:hypothetical protein
MRAKKLDHPTIFIQIQDLQGETQLTLNFGGKTRLTLPFFLLHYKTSLVIDLHICVTMFGINEFIWH